MKLGFRTSTIVIAAVLPTGCASNRAHKGAVIDPQLASSIQPGTVHLMPDCSLTSLTACFARTASLAASNAVSRQGPVRTDVR